MSTPINNFLLSLAAAIASETGLQLGPPAAALWAHEAVEASSAAVFSVLRIYGGSETARFAGVRVPRCRVQVDTRGKVAPDVLARAWLIHEALLDDDSRPRLTWSIAGKRKSAAGGIEADPAGGWLAWVCDLPSVPGVVGRDEQGRSMAFDNFEIQFERVLP